MARASLDVHRVLEALGLEVEEQQAHRAAVLGGAEGDRAEGLGVSGAQVLLDPVGVAQPRERDAQGHVAGPAAGVHRDLVVRGHVDDAVDQLLQARGVGIEQLARREAVEQAADLAVGVAVGHRPALGQDPLLLLLQERDVCRLLREGALGEAALQERRRLQSAVRAPLPHNDVVDGLEVVDRRGVVAVVHLDDACVLPGGDQVLLDLLHEARAARPAAGRGP